ILKETAEKIVIQRRREKCERGRILGDLVRKAITKPPNNIVPAGDMEMMLKIDIERIEIVDQYSRRSQRDGAYDTRRDWIRQMGPVVVHLQAHVRSVRKGMRPAPEHVAAAHISLTAGRDAFVARVIIPLKR